MISDIALPLQQHPHFAAALTRLGRTVQFANVAGAAPVLTVRQWGQSITSRGPIWHEDRCSDSLRKAGLRLINADTPNDALLHGAGFRRLMTNTHMAKLDLQTPLDERRRAMKPKWRNAWRSAQNAALTVYEVQYNTHEHAWVLQADLAQQRAKRFRGLPHTLIDAFAAGQPKSVRVLICCTNNSPIAAMLFLLHAPVVTYHIGWTSLQGRKLHAHHRMIMEAAERFAQRGYYRMDLGAVDTDRVPGLARFKIGTGAQVRPLGGTWLRLPKC